jgi:hypothetical protein
LKHRGLGSEGALALGDNETLAEESLTLWRGETLHRSLTAIVSAKDFGITYNGERYLVICPRTEVAVLIDHLGRDKGCVLTLIVRRETDMVWGAGGLDDLSGYDLSLTISCRRGKFAGNSLDLAWLELYTPAYMVFSGEPFDPFDKFRDRVRCLTADALALTIDEELHLIGIVIVGPEIDGLSG